MSRLLEPPFALDRFQLDAIAALDDGRSVLVAAPTGSGKTVVAEAAIDMALASRGKAFYTTPIKALSNQKFVDLTRRLGEARVGLLTGDTAINGDAPVVVMTTEVLRNMIYAGSSALEGLHYVVLDEVHYLQDTYRGPVWEEVIIHLPANVRLVCLSATVSNANELGEWLTSVRGPTTTVIETQRPVELETLYMVGDRTAEVELLMPLLVDGRPNPEGHRFTEDPRVARRAGGRFRRRYVTPRRLEVIDRLDDEGLLPAIYFIFSRNACDDAVAVCRDAGMRFTDPEERAQIREIAERRTARLADADLDVLGYDSWLAALEMGIAAHHAGLVPAFKEVVETCFTAGLVRVVFATETLALGINMPARSVVIERLTKYNGETHEFLTPGEFTQLTGRAGRRGIDDEGFAVALWSPFVPFDQVATLAASRSFPLRSAFRPTYNMSANLVTRYDRAGANAVLARSFAQFQADRASGGLQGRLADDLRKIDECRAAATCERGSVDSYAEATERLERARRGRPEAAKAIRESLAMLRPGDLVEPAMVEAVRAGSGERLVVISVAYRGASSLRVRGVDRDAEVHQFDVGDLAAPVHSLGQVELPVPYAPGSRDFRQGCARLLAELPIDDRRRGRAARPAERDDELAALEAAVVVHPVHRCPDRQTHLEARVAVERLQREISDVQGAVARRSASVVRRFEAVIDLLVRRGHVFVEVDPASWTLTASGRRLASVYHECDLLIAEALGTDVLDGLDEAELAAVVSCWTYEERRPDAPATPEIPTKRVRRAVERLRQLAEELRAGERAGGLPPTRLPDAGLAAVVHAWVAGDDLEDVLGDDHAPGDFVRNVKVLVDLLSQVAQVAPDPVVRETARRAATEAVRGVVSASSEVVAG
ncbi:MAG TPA: DEAD/DEAH box helicase [Microthrixaceae bacterium]|nr:DEAD/DEAH box helicase [Microthrixaceae bacterium]